MNSIEQARLNPFYAAMLRALQLQGKAEKTIEAYARAVRRSADFFERCPDELTAEDLQTYFAALLKSHSWFTVKLDRCGLQFLYRDVLKRPWDWTEIVKPPRPQRLPDVPITETLLHMLRQRAAAMPWRRGAPPPLPLAADPAALFVPYSQNLGQKGKEFIAHYGPASAARSTRG